MKISIRKCTDNLPDPPALGSLPFPEAICFVFKVWGENRQDIYHTFLHPGLVKALQNNPEFQKFLEV